MADRVDRETRSRIMAAVRSADTGPELVVRRLAHKMGYRYRLNVRALPGSPDVVFSGRRKVIFVHGCFWHRHRCKRGTTPKTRLSYWLPKFEANQRRDRDNMRELRRAGWDILTVWECHTRRPERLRARLRAFLENQPEAPGVR